MQIRGCMREGKESRRGCDTKDGWSRRDFDLDSRRSSDPTSPKLSSSLYVVPDHVFVGNIANRPFVYITMT